MPARNIRKFHVIDHGSVPVPLLQIWDERGIPIRNKFYNAGSTIELKCSISKVPKPSHFILWKHGTSILNYDVTRGGIRYLRDILKKLDCIRPLK